MADDRNKPAGIDQSVRSPAQKQKRAFVGKAFVIALAVFVVFGFCIYIFAGIYGASAAN